MTYSAPGKYFAAHFPLDPVKHPGTSVILFAVVDGARFAVRVPDGIDWADYEPQEKDAVQDLRIPRDPWTYYQQAYPEIVGDTPQPSEADVLAWVPPAPPDPAPVTDVEIARQYAGAYQAASDIIFLLMSRVSTALVVGKHFTAETVNKEGSRFTRYHKDEIEAFKLAGRHPDAGDALYEAVAASADEFPWLRANGGTILNIFATTLPRNSK